MVKARSGTWLTWFKLTLASSVALCFREPERNTSTSSAVRPSRLKASVFQRINGVSVNKSLFSWQRAWMVLSTVFSLNSVSLAMNRVLSLLIG